MGLFLMKIIVVIFFTALNLFYPVHAMKRKNEAFSSQASSLSKRPNLGHSPALMALAFKCAEEKFGQEKVLECLNVPFNEVLFKAAQDNDIGTMKTLLSSEGLIKSGKLDIEFLDPVSGLNPLFMAAKSGHYDATKLLLDHGASIEVKNGQSILHCAAMGGNIDLLKYLFQHHDVHRFLEAKYTSDAEYLEGCTPLFAAAMGGNLPAFQFLLKQGADINVVTKNENTILHFADGNVQILELLFNFHNAKKWLEQKDLKGMTPLLLFAKAQRNNDEAIKFLLSKGADVKTLDSNKNTIIHLAARKVEVLKYLFQEKDGKQWLENRNQEGLTPLANAAALGSYEGVRFLIESGADVDGITLGDATILHFVVTRGNGALLEYLFKEHNALKWLERKNSYGCTPLLVAALRGNKEAVKFLLEKGADINVLSHKNASVLHGAIISGNLDLLNYLFQSHNAEQWINTPDKGRKFLSYAAQIGNVAVFKYLLEKGAVIDQNGGADIVLCSGVLSGNVEFIDFLFSIQGFQSWLKYKTSQGESTLLFAAQKGRLEIVKYLLKKGASIDVIDKESRNIFHLGVFNENLNLLQYLFDAYKNKNWLKTTDAIGRTPLLAAAASGKIKSFEYLLKNGAQSTEVDKAGATILHVGALYGQIEFLKFLLRSNMLRPFLEAKMLNGSTPVLAAAYFRQAAAYFRQTEAVKFLAEQGANINATDYYENTILHLAANSGNIELLKYLFAKHNALIYINQKTKDGYTPIQIARLQNQEQALKFLQAQAIIHDITPPRAPKNSNVASGQNVQAELIHPLLRAALDGDLGQVQFLLAKGNDSNVRSPNSKATILHFAAESGNSKLLEFLFTIPNAHAWLEERTLNGNTPLLIAVRNGHVGCTRFLLTQGANINVVNNFGETILHAAAFSRNHELWQFLMQLIQAPRPAPQIVNAPIDPPHQAMRNETLDASSVPAYVHIKDESIDLAPPKAPLAAHLLLLKNRQYNEFTEALAIIRGNNNVQDNCTHLTKAVLRYFQTGIATEASTAPSTYVDYPAFVESSITQVKTEGNQKRITQIDTAGFFAGDFDNFLSALPAYVDVTYSIDLTDEEIQITSLHKEKKLPVREGKYYLRNQNINDGLALNKKLMQLANEDTQGISYGFITLGRAGSKGIELAGHMLAYFATSEHVIFIDLQLLNGALKEGNPIFSDLKEHFKFVNAQQKTDLDTFGQFIFYAPVK